VGANQALINDKDKGDKGFTPDAFEKKLQAKFKERSGVDLTNLAGASIPHPSASQNSAARARRVVEDRRGQQSSSDQ
jgi:hypothetical protein